MALKENISFTALLESDFPLLLKWLELPHIKKWWDPDVVWDIDLIKARYANYVKGYKILRIKDGGDIKKPIQAFIMHSDKTPIGYIQYYNKHDFPSHHGYDSTMLPISCAGMDLYIGDLDYTGQNIGTKALELFINDYIFTKFDYVFVDPEIDNNPAVRAYTKAGFEIIRLLPQEGVFWMLKSRE